jgi:Protein of unknown function (DUF3592)
MYGFIPLVLMAIGAGLLWLGWRLRRGGGRFELVARPATATVVGLQWRGHPADAFPVFRFDLPGGEPVEAVSTWGSRPARFTEGDRVEILYDPRNPTHIRVPGENTAAAFLTVALVFAGVGFVGLGVLLGLVLYLLSQMD